MSSLPNLLGAESPSSFPENGAHLNSIRRHDASDSWVPPSPYLPHRRHLVAQLLHAFPPLLLYQHLLCPNLLSLIVRVVIQIRLCAPRIRHPGTSLLQLSLGVVMLNAVIILMHVLDLMDGVNNIGKGLVLDFVGLKTRPRASTVYILDILCTFWQLITLNVAFLSDPGPGRDSGDTKLMASRFADDLLLPSHAVSLVSTLRARRQRKKKSRTLSNAANEHDEAEQGLLADEEAAAEDEDEDDDISLAEGPSDRVDDGAGSERDSLLENERGQTAHSSHVDRDRTTSRTNGHHDLEAPLIADIPFVHFWQTIVSYPSPSSTSRILSMGDAMASLAETRMRSRPTESSNVSMAAETERRENVARRALPDGLVPSSQSGRSSDMSPG